jgi:hypothetical protein
LVAYLPSAPLGVWQSLHVAAVRWLPVIHAEY